MSFLPISVNASKSKGAGHNYKPKVGRDNVYKPSLDDLLQKAKIDAAIDEQHKREHLRKEKVAAAKIFKLTSGIKLSSSKESATLKAYPIHADKLLSYNSNKVILPASILENITRQQTSNKFSSRDVDYLPMTFELTLMLKVDDAPKMCRTYCGVEEFTAEEGTIGLPPKTVLSLLNYHRDYSDVEIFDEDEVSEGRSRFDLLSGNVILEIKYVKLQYVPKLFMQIRPKAKGFGLLRDKKVDVDIKRLFEKTLQSQACVAKGDIIPLFIKDNSDENIEVLVEVVDLRGEEVYDDDLPNDVIDELSVEDLADRVHIDFEAFIVLRNEVSVDMLPSEDDQREIQREKKIKQAEHVIVQRIMDFSRDYFSINPTSAMKNTYSVTFRVRMPIAVSKKSTNTISKSFDIGSTLKDIYDWILAELGGASEMSLAELFNSSKCNLNKCLKSGYPFYIRQPTIANSSSIFSEGNLERTLSELGLIDRGYALSVLIYSKQDETQVIIPDERIQEANILNPWESAYNDFKLNFGKTSSESTYLADLTGSPLRKSQSLDIADNVSSQTTTDVSEKEEEAYNELVNAFGVPSAVASKAAKYWESIGQLKDMGFGDRLNEAAELLIKYNGRVVRVANALVGNS